MLFCAQCKRWLSVDDAFCPDDGGSGENHKEVPPGAKLGPYRFERKLGEGGMGYVMEAKHEVLNRRTAIKFLLPQFATNNVVVTRFLQEAKSVNMINHENIINIYDYGYAPDKSVYFVMEYLEGEELSKFHKRLGKVPLDLLFPIYLQIMKALAAAHEKDIIHRDLKPANVFLQKRDENPYFVKVLDFGVAKLRGEGKIEGLTRAGALLGTPQFMSPEQVSGEAVDARSDLFSLTIMLYRAATGKLPFQGQGFAALAQQICLEEPPRPRDVNPELPEGLEKLILKGLIKEKDKRYQTMREMLNDFDKLRVEAGIAESLTPSIASSVPPPSTDNQPAPTGNTQSEGTTSVPAFQGSGTQSGVASSAPKPTETPQVKVEPAPLPKSKPWLVIVLGLVAVAGVGVYLVSQSSPTEKTTITENNKDNPTPIDKTPPPAPKSIKEQAEARLQQTITDGEPPQSKIDAAAAVSGVVSARSVKVLQLVYLALEKGTPQASKETYQALAALKLPEATAKLQAKLSSVGGNRGVEIAAALLEIGDSSGESILKKSITGGDPNAKMIAAVALARAKKDDGKAYLEEQLAANNPGKTAWLLAVEGLAALGDEKAKKLLNDELTSGDELRLINAAAILGRLGEQSGKDTLARVVQDTNFTQRAAAALALARLGDDGAYAFVESGLKDAVDADARYAAIIVAGRFPQKGAEHKATLEKLFQEDPSAKVQLAAAAALVALD